MEAFKQKEFIADSEIAWDDLGGGLKRKVMAYDDNLMMVKVAFEKRRDRDAAQPLSYADELCRKRGVRDHDR